MNSWQNILSNTKRIKIYAITILACLVLSGCANPFEGGKDSISVVLTTGFSKDEVFRIEDISCSLAEVEVYLVNMQNSYQSTLGMVYGRLTLHFLRTLSLHALPALLRSRPWYFWLSTTGSCLMSLSRKLR